jgi:thiamine transporter ThiT
MVPYPGTAMGVGNAGRVRREVLALIGWVIAVDAVFIAGYFAASMAARPNGVKLFYTVCWTAVTLGVVLRGLLRVRSERVRRLTVRDR